MKRSNAYDKMKILVIVTAAVLCLAVIISGLLIWKSTVFNNDKELWNPNVSVSEGKWKDYFPRQDITTLLLIGVDAEGKVKDSGFSTNEGAADVLSLIIFDEKTEKINIIALNRDSMVEMPILGISGYEAGTVYGQLALSHTYGRGLEDSCENTVNTVSALLGGIRIDYYAALNMEGVALLNDAVGGVTVNVTDDFSEVNPAIKKGEFTLKGQQALDFVRARKDLGDQLNISRMERQREYVDGFMKAFKAKSNESSSFAMELLDAVNGYLVTDCSGNTLMGMADRYMDYEIDQVVSPKGENKLGKEHYEFYIDEKDLEKIVTKFLLTEKLK